MCMGTLKNMTKMGRPKRRPYDRVNYKLDSEIRKILKILAVKSGRTEGSQVEQCVLTVEALNRLVNREEKISLVKIKNEVDNIWNEIISDEVES